MQGNFSILKLLTRKRMLEGKTKAYKFLHLLQIVSNEHF